MSSTVEPERRVSPLQRGAVIAGRYEVVQCLGVGSLGTVYLCRAIEDHLKLVALKELAPTQTSGPTGQVSLARFRNEIATLLRIRHPHVVQIFEYVSEPNLTAYLMDFVAGGDLASYMRNHPPFTIPEIVRLLRQICQGVNAIWQAGIVHRDLKPSNILLSEGLDVKIADFGIARSEDGPRLTARGGVVGTIEYLSPQYLEDGTISPQGDVYAIGVIAYELITGRTPYAGFGLLKTVELKVTSDPTPPESRNPECPEWLSRIVLRAMARDAKQRYSSAIEVDYALAIGESTFSSEQRAQSRIANIVPFRHSASLTAPSSGSGSLSPILPATEVDRIPSGSHANSVVGHDDPESSVLNSKPTIIPIAELAAEFYSTGTIAARSFERSNSSSAIIPSATGSGSVQVSTQKGKSKRRPPPRIMHLARLGAGGFGLGLVLLFAFTPAAWRGQPRPLEVASIVSSNTVNPQNVEEFSLVSNSRTLDSEQPDRDAEYARLNQESNSAMLEPVTVEGDISAHLPPPLKQQDRQYARGVPAEKVTVSRKRATVTKDSIPPPNPPSDVGRRVTSAVASITTNLDTITDQKVVAPIQQPNADLTPYEVPASDVQEPSDEFKVRATLLYRMADYVQWPSTVLVSQQDPFTICILGRDPFGKYLDTLLSKAQSRSGHHFATHRLAIDTPSSALASCQVLYLNRVPASRAEKTLAGLANRSTLVISENTGNGMIDFVVRDGKVKFTVDSGQAAAAGLTIGSVLRDLAVPKEE